jgi:hypothetical protein
MPDRWEIFLDSLQNSQRIDYLMEWSTVSANLQKAEPFISTFFQTHSGTASA